MVDEVAGNMHSSLAIKLTDDIQLKKRGFKVCTQPDLETAAAMSTYHYPPHSSQ